MPACFVRQNCIVITVLTSHHAINRKSGRQQDPPGFAAAAVHHTPHQLFARFVCQSVRAKLSRLQLVAHAYEQAASDIQAHHQQKACTLTMLHVHWQSISIFMVIHRKRRTLIRLNSKCSYQLPAHGPVEVCLQDNRSTSLQCSIC